MAAMAGRKWGGHNQEATGKFSGCVTESTLCFSIIMGYVTMVSRIFA
jgi:hypothetical protein